ncbi:MAG: hypothetical protein M1830_006606, partial [Pleopsidium flavum]
SRSQPSAVRAEVEQAASAVQSLPLHRLSSLALNPATEASSATRSTARRSIDFYPAPSPRSSQPASQLTLESSSEDPHVARAPEANTPAAPARASELTADEQARDEAMLREVLRLSAGEVVKDPEDGIDDPPPSYEEAIAAPPASAPAA